MSNLYFWVYFACDFRQRLYMYFWVQLSKARIHPLPKLVSNDNPGHETPNYSSLSQAASSLYYYPGILSKHSAKKLSFQILLRCITEREKLFLQNLDDTWILLKRKKGNIVSVRDCIEGNMCIQVKKNYYLERTETNMGMASYLSGRRKIERHDLRADKYFDKQGVVGENFD